MPRTTYTVAAILLSRAGRNSSGQGQGSDASFLFRVDPVTSPPISLPIFARRAAVAILGRKILICECGAVDDHMAHRDVDTAE